MYASNLAGVRYYTQVNPHARKGKADPVTLESPTFEDILRLAEQGEPRAIEAIERMAHYIGSGIALLVTGLAPDAIVVVGEVTRLWHRIEPVIQRIVKGRTFTHAPTRIIPTDPSAQPRLRGTIALVLQKHFGAPALM
jgi:predicted NBD/HSP70 family sugar kinase